VDSDEEVAMRKRVLDRFWLALASLLAVPLWAHHSITAEFDTSKTFSVKGTLTKVEWVNPHAYIYVDSKNEKGTAIEYSFETGPPGNLRRAGVLRTMFTAGGLVTIDAYEAKDGTKHLGLVKSITFSDGHTIVMGKDPKDLEKVNKGE
jgi:Family of unknown function (DUF6152)